MTLFWRYGLLGVELAVVDTVMACVWILMPPECNPVPTGLAALKKKGFSIGLALVDL